MDAETAPPPVLAGANPSPAAALTDGGPSPVQPVPGHSDAVPNGPHGFCHACFSGDYPTPPPTDPEKLRFGCGC